MQTWQSEPLMVLHTVTVVQGSISSEMGQHCSSEHLLLTAQGNCTFTSRRSSLRESETDGGLKAVEGREELLFIHTLSSSKFRKDRKSRLTEVGVVKLARLDPDSGAGAEVDAQADHVVQLEVGEGLREVTRAA